MKRVWLTAALLCLTLLCGCSNQVIMSDRLLIRGIGVDSLGENRYCVSVHIMKTTEQQDTAEFLQAEGESVLDALNNLTLQVGKTPLYSHNLVVIFGKQCAEQGLDFVLDFFQRQRETRPNVDVFLAESSASEIMGLKHENRYILSQDIDDLASAAEINGKVANTQVYQIVNMNYRNASPYMPVLRDEGGKIVVDGTAFFEGWKLKGVLDEDETRGLLFLTQNLDEGNMVIDLENMRMTASLTDVKRSVDISIKNGVPSFQIDIFCEAHISSIDGAISKRLDSSYYKKFEEKLEEKILEQSNAAIEKTVLENSCDVFSFGRMLYQQQTEWWRHNQANWNRLMGECSYSITVNTLITRVEQELTPDL